MVDCFCCNGRSRASNLEYLILLGLVLMVIAAILTYTMRHRRTQYLISKEARWATIGLFWRILLTIERWGERTWVENRIPVEKPSRVLTVTKQRDIRREELVGERNRREGKNAINITYIQMAHEQGEFYAQKVLWAWRRLVNHLSCMPRYRYDGWRGFEKTMPKMWWSRKTETLAKAIIGSSGFSAR